MILFNRAAAGDKVARKVQPDDDTSSAFRKMMQDQVSGLRPRLLHVPYFDAGSSSVMARLRHVLMLRLLVKSVSSLVGRSGVYV